MAVWVHLRRLAGIRHGDWVPFTGEGSRRVSARHRFGAGLAVLVLAVSACSGGDDPATSPSSTSTSSSSTPSTTSSSSAPSSSTAATIYPADLPADARKHSSEGAVAFANYYISQVNEAWSKPDATLLPPLSNPDCLSCADLQSTARDLVAKNNRYVSQPITIRSAKFVGNEQAQTHVRVLMTQNRVNVVDAQGQVVSTDAKKEFARTVGVTWEGNRWVLFGIA